MAGRKDFTIIKNSVFRASFTTKDKLGNVIDITDYNISLVTDDCDIKAVITKQDANTFIVEISAEESAKITSNYIRYNLILESEKERIVLLYGDFIFKRSIKCKGG